MGTYAENSYDLRIPLDQVPAIMAACRAGTVGSYSWTNDLIAQDTPEALVQLITEVHGNEDEEVDFTVVDTEVLLDGGSYGKISGALAEVDIILAAHGVTGTIAWECEGIHGLTEFKDGVAQDHEGVITYPTYKPADQ